MTAVNLTRKKEHSLKKSSSVSSANLDFSDVAAAADFYELFNLPEDAIITHLFTDVLEAFDAGTTMAIGYDGGSEVEAAVVLDAVGVDATLNVNLATGTGKRITAQLNQNVTQGKMAVMIKYIEYNLNNGELTNFSDTP